MLGLIHFECATTADLHLVEAVKTPSGPFRQKASGTNLNEFWGWGKTLRRIHVQ